MIGDSQYQNERLAITGKAWNPANEINDLLTFDIGIMPLPMMNGRRKMRA